jgi:hypothetical protein
MSRHLIAAGNSAATLNIARRCAATWCRASSSTARSARPRQGQGSEGVCREADHAGPHEHADRPSARDRALQDRRLVDENQDFIEEGPTRTVVHRLFNDVAPKFADRRGGYTRIIKTSDFRIGDGGDIVLLQLLTEESPRRAPRVRPPASAASATSASISSPPAP